MTSSTEAFASGLAESGQAPPATDDPAATAELDAALARAIAAGHDAWPALATTLAAEEFARHLGRCVASLGEDADALAVLPDLQVGDLFLACAAGQGTPEAIEIVCTTHLDQAIGAARRIHDAPAFLGDVTQILRQRLFVAGDDEPPKILSYYGRAALGIWLGAVAQKTALSLLRSDSAQERLKVRVAAEAAIAALDPELQHIQAHYSRYFEEAFRHALGELSDRSRTLLRLHVFVGRTLDHLANAYGVNDATISRWLVSARRELLEGTSRYMRETLGVSPEDFDSLARVLTSQLDISIARLLDEPPPPAAAR